MALAEAFGPSETMMRLDQSILPVKTGVDPVPTEAAAAVSRTASSAANTMTQQASDLANLQLARGKMRQDMWSEWRQRSHEMGMQQQKLDWLAKQQKEEQTWLTQQKQRDAQLQAIVAGLRQSDPDDTAGQSATLSALLARRSALYGHMSTIGLIATRAQQMDAFNQQESNILQKALGGVADKLSERLKPPTTQPTSLNEIVPTDQYASFHVGLAQSSDNALTDIVNGVAQVTPAPGAAEAIEQVAKTFGGPTPPQSPQQLTLPVQVAEDAVTWLGQLGARLQDYMRDNLGLDAQTAVSLDHTLQAINTVVRNYYSTQGQMNGDAALRQWNRATNEQLGMDLPTALISGNYTEALRIAHSELQQIERLIESYKGKDVLRLDRETKQKLRRLENQKLQAAMEGYQTGDFSQVWAIQAEIERLTAEQENRWGALNEPVIESLLSGPAQPTTRPTTQE